MADKNDLCEIRNVYPLALIDWLLEATKAREARDGELSGTLALLYDIGCTLKKGIIKVGI
jgi:hypothetical protein